MNKKGLLLISAFSLAALAATPEAQAQAARGSHPTPVRNAVKSNVSGKPSSVSREATGFRSSPKPPSASTHQLAASNSSVALTRANEVLATIPNTSVRKAASVGIARVNTDVTKAVSFGTTLSTPERVTYNRALQSTLDTASKGLREISGRAKKGAPLNNLLLQAKNLQVKLRTIAGQVPLEAGRAQIVKASDAIDATLQNARAEGATASEYGFTASAVVYPLFDALAVIQHVKRSGHDNIIERRPY